jgi:Domain of unknown function (DUF4276)
MHIEFLVEDSSGAKLIESLLPRLIGRNGDSHSWRIKSYKGIGKIPKGLRSNADPAKRILLEQLPRLLQGYGNTPGIGGVVVVLDSDDRDCKEFLKELHDMLNACRPAPRTLFRLAIEEMEAWLLGDRQALINAYPAAKKEVVNRYIQDSVCGTWELMADAIYSGGSAKLRDAGWPLPGQVKHEWVEKIAPHMNVEDNLSPSFCKFRDGVRRIVGSGELA